MKVQTVTVNWANADKAQNIGAFFSPLQLIVELFFLLSF